MNDFVYSNKTKLIFGKDVENKIGSEIKLLGYTNILIVYGQQSVIKSGLLDRTKASLTNAGLQFVEFGGVSANPTKSHMLQGVELAKSKGVDFVLGVGGGSVIDEAKAIAVGAVNDDVWRIFTDNNAASKMTKVLPTGAVLTLPAAGSENSTASVIRDEISGRKYSIGGNELIRPAIAFVNPELMFTLPKVQIANGASDMLAHMLERYFSPQTDVVATDYLLMGGIQAVLDIAPKLYKDNTNYQLWLEFCLLGTVAHNNMLSMGRNKQDWGTHVMENQFLSGVYNIAHGTGLAILFLSWLKLMLNKKPQKILQFCKQVMKAQGDDDTQVIKNGIENLRLFYKSLDLPVSLSEVNIEPNAVKEIAKQIFDKKTKLGAYGELNIDDMIQIIDFAS
jgi:alcohol dehydrogenase YqhD (iron-dependent ADH family)